MDTMTAIATRRTIRKYTDQPVADELVRQLLNAGFVAPSAFDERPWHFVVVDDRATLQALAEKMESCEMLQTAALAILICGDPALEQFENYWVQDCSACAQNILLAAHANGLGGCWIAMERIPPREAAVREALAVPEHIAPFALLSLGYPDESLPGEDRYDASRVHHGQW